MNPRFLVLSTLVLAACSGAEPPAPAPLPALAPEPAPTAVVADPTHETSAGYAIGVKKIAEDRAQLQTLLDSGKLADLHKVAEGLAKTAKALPSTCDSLGDPQKADVAAQAQQLQDLFKPLDETGDGGDKDKAATALKGYDAPIAALQAYLP